VIIMMNSLKLTLGELNSAIVANDNLLADRLGLKIENLVRAILDMDVRNGKDLNRKMAMICDLILLNAEDTSQVRNFTEILAGLVRDSHMTLARPTPGDSAISGQLAQFPHLDHSEQAKSA
jgi:hypothetical protein